MNPTLWWMQAGTLLSDYKFTLKERDGASRRNGYGTGWEIVCADSSGRPQFTDLLFHRTDPCFFAFDLPIRHGTDERSHQLQDRKQELRSLLVRVPADSPLKYADHIDGSGIALHRRICDLDLEGIVAKLRSAPYVSHRDSTTREGREELFERDRHAEAVPGWHTCTVACAELQELYAEAF